MNEKINNKLLAIPLTLCFFIIAIFCFFCIGLSRVDAKKLITFTKPEIIRNVTGTSSTNFGTILSYCDNGWTCNVPSLDIISMTGVITNLNKSYSNVSSEEFLLISGHDYTINFYYELYKTENTLTNIKPSLAVYTNSGWVLATCDVSTVTSNTIQNNTNTSDIPVSYVQKYNYNCELLNVTVDSPTFRTGIFVNNTNDRFSGLNTVRTYITMVDHQRAGDGTDIIIENATQNAQDIINNANQNTDKVVDAIEKSEETNQGILDVITDFFSNFFDGLIGIFVPNNFDFLTGFLDTLENKLGFIASIPIQFLEFLGNLVTIDFDTVTSVTLPNFEILGYKFIEEQEIDLSEIMAVFQPYRIYTNIGCVCLCIRYLMKLYENFANKE